ncbi:DinB family protein [Thalassiella azotivora]
MTVAPDDKDWTWVLDRRCPECGEDAQRIRPEQVADLVRSSAVEWERVLAGHPLLRERPDPATWSPLEYACHVRDVYRVFDDRLALVLAEDDPEFANWDQDATAAASDYDRQEPARVSLDLAEAARRLADRFDTVPADGGWDRPARRSNGSRFTVLTLARYLLHDVVHHLHDVRLPRRR